jgi:hypothetical protein
MSEAHRIEYVVTEAMAEPAMLAFLEARKIGKPTTRSDRVKVWTLVAAFGGLAAYGWAVGVSNWLNVPFAVVAAFFAFANVFNQWYVGYVRAGFLKSVKELAGIPVEWTVRDDGISLQSARGPREIPWTTVRSVYRGREFWLLEEAWRATLIPVAAFTEASERFFLDRARAAGSTICGDSPGVEADYDDGPANNR